MNITYTMTTAFNPNCWDFVQFIQKSKWNSPIWTRYKWHYVLFIAHILKMWLSFLMRKCKRISRPFNGITANNMCRNEKLFSLHFAINHEMMRFMYEWFILYIFTQAIQLFSICQQIFEVHLFIHEQFGLFTHENCWNLFFA